MAVREDIGGPDVLPASAGLPTRRDKAPLKYLPIVFLLASLPGLAQDSAQYRACNEKAKTQTKMNACAIEEAAHVDAEPNEVYHKLLSQAGSAALETSGTLLRDVVIPRGFRNSCIAEQAGDLA